MPRGDDPIKQTSEISASESTQAEEGVPGEMGLRPRGQSAMFGTKKSRIACSLPIYCTEAGIHVRMRTRVTQDL